ncbi:hypothetical protein C4561_05245 [candidate division WWE3 bacterium]|jgi:hypothetical protein|uniref:Uncharacterized protein n=1 Tax=candidate division WWE3 bacterium TaxID=2053526 RepID=A0A3A4ZB84_UNCKA|nr:MAG: hypothetical protein C4561_05245 [candidate division WWE3 bacterium]
MKGKPPVGTPGTEYESHILHHDVDSLQESYLLVQEFLEQKVKSGWTLLFGRFNSSKLLEETETLPQQQ